MVPASTAEQGEGVVESQDQPTQEQFSPSMVTYCDGSPAADSSVDAAPSYGAVQAPQEAQEGGAGLAVPPQEIASLYVCDLAEEVTEAMLFTTFSQCGPIVSIRVCREPSSRRSLGYAYVNFHLRSDGRKVMSVCCGLSRISSRFRSILISLLDLSVIISLIISLSLRIIS